MQKKIILADQIWQLKEIFATKNNLDEFVFVSLNPECSYFLKKKKIVIIGAGGHARSCIDVIENTNSNFKILGLVEKKYL